MVNIKKRTLRPEQQRFIDEIASLFAPWGMPGSEARVYGYVLQSQEPVSLDRLALELQMSKVSAWKSARSLEGFGHIRRYGEPGSKRALYGPTEKFAAPLLEQCALLGALGSTLQDHAATIADADASARLQRMAELYLALREAMETTIQRFESPKAKAKPATKRPVTRSKKKAG